MKKLIMLTLSLAMVLSVFMLYANAEETGVKVYVTISNGDLMLVRQEVTVTDEDSDGKITINDSLIAAHREYYEGDGEGYLSEVTAFGISMIRLWGLENGGSYGYYVNNAMAFSLAGEVNEGDRVYAFAYTDTITYGDTYTYFDSDTVTVKAGEEISLTLYSLTLDDEWNPVISAVSDAVITFDGAETGYVTDNDGRVTLKIENEGSCLISAKSDTLTLLPPVCFANVTASTPKTFDGFGYVLYISAGAVAFAVIIYLLRRSRNYEK